MAVLNYRKSIAEAIARSMRRDERVVFLGEDVAAAGGAFKTTVGLLDEFGPGRVWDTPISEQAIIGAAIGAAATGLRPIAEIMFADFLGTCWDGIANHAAKLRYMSAGQLQVPMVIRAHGGAGLGFGAQHSQLWENLAMAIPGLKVVLPSTPDDLVGLFQSAVDDPDPVLFLEHKGLFDAKADIPDDHVVPLGVANRVRSGDDVTVVTIGAMRRVAIDAADLLAQDGVHCDVIDLRTLVPLDFEAVSASVERTGRVVILEEGSRSCGWGAEVSSLIAQELFWSLDAPVKRVTSAPSPVPFAGSLETAWLPQPEDVRQAVLTLDR